MTQHLLFAAGGLNLAAPAELVRAIHENLSVQPVAGTRKWFCGLAVAHGKLLPVTDIGAFSGRRSSTGRTLELDPSVGIAGLQVDSVFGLSETRVTEVPLNEKEHAETGDVNLALTERAVVQETRVHRLLDIASLVQSRAFVNIAENE